MLSDIRQKLAGAAGTGEIVRVMYLGGSQPGAVRDIQPVKLSEDRVLAWCHSAGSLRTFLLERMEIVGDGEPLSYDVQVPPGRIFTSLDDTRVKLARLLDRPEWHVAGSIVELAVFARFKNGKPRRSPLVMLSFTGNERRPWLVATRLRSRTFETLDSAVAAFLKSLDLKFDWRPGPPSGADETPANAAAATQQQGHEQPGLWLRLARWMTGRWR